MVYLWNILWFAIKEIIGSIPLLRTVLRVHKYRAKHQHAANKEAVLFADLPPSDP